MRQRPEVWAIVSGSCGCFLEPPGHPSYSYEIIEGPRKDPLTIMGLMSAIDPKNTYIPENIRKQAKELLDAYQPPSIDSKEAQDWIDQVLGYFRDCYRNPKFEGEAQWYASNIIIGSKESLFYNDPIKRLDDHCGVHHIRKTYPNWTPTKENFTRAYWGKKPQ